MSDLETFFEEVGKTPLLTREQEVQLAQQIEAGDQQARDHMIRANLRLAISIAKQYQNKGCAMEDLIQESSIGLIKAVDRFDWRRGFKFSTYACWWIKQCVRQHVASNTSAFRLPTYAKNIMYKIHKTVAEYEEEFGERPTQEEISEALGLSVDTIKSMIRCGAPTVSIHDDTRSGRGSAASRPYHEILPDTSPRADEMLDKQKVANAIHKAMGTLTIREQKILRLRFGIGETAEDAETFGIGDAEYQIILSKCENK
jgi:RNA polymerase primary sigma factor